MNSDIFFFHLVFDFKISVNHRTLVVLKYRPTHLLLSQKVVPPKLYSEQGLVLPLCFYWKIMVFKLVMLYTHLSTISVRYGSNPSLILRFCICNLVSEYCLDLLLTVNIFNQNLESVFSLYWFKPSRMLHLNIVTIML